MLVTLLILWVLISGAFFGGLAFLARRPIPQMDEDILRPPVPENELHREQAAPDATAPAHCAPVSV